MNNVWKKYVITLMAILLLIPAVSCKRTNRASDGSVEVIIGAGFNYYPYWYLDDNNQLTGFEKAVLDEIDRRLTQYTFTYQKLDFTNILLSLESGKVDVGAHQFEFNIERNAKYLYGTEGYTTFEQYLVVREDDNSITSFKDLAGKKLIVENNSNNKFYVSNKWNEENGRIFTIIFQPNIPLMIEELEAGLGDATIAIERNVNRYKEEYNAKIKLSGPPVSDSQTYYIFHKVNGGQLQKDFDEAIKSMKEDGTLTRLSIEWLGGDYTPKN